MMFMRRWRAAGARILPLAANSSAALARLHATSFARGWTSQEIAELMAGPAVDVIGAKLGSQMLGMAMVRCAADEGEVLTIAVAPDWRGMGLAGRLLGEALGALARRRTRTCFLEVEEHNQAALALYRREGFHEIGRRKGYYGDEGGGDALILACSLTDRWWLAPPPDAVESE
ncbi:ribosomal protein S18-alanine N-acetyltransferase [Candidatus Raskinella chloraquaticus]